MTSIALRMDEREPAAALLGSAIAHRALAAASPPPRGPAATTHSPLDAATIQLRLITTAADFEALEAPWNALLDQAGTGADVFQSYNFCWHWWRHYVVPAASRVSLSIIVGEVDGRAVLVLPLATERTRGLRQLIWLGDPAGQYGDAIIDPNLDAMAALGRAWAFLAANVRVDVVRLRRVRSDARIAPFLSQIGAAVTASYEAPFLALASASGFTDYETRYSAKARKNRRRLLRRLQERGPVQFIDHASGPGAADAAERAVMLKRQWLVSRNLVSKALHDDRIIGFMRDAASATVRPVGCEVGELRVGDETASVQIGFRYRDRLALHVIVFDLAFEKAGAGVLHMEQRIQRGCDQGVGVLDLLSPKSDYKMDWADGCVAVDDVAIPMTLKGRTFVQLYLLGLRPRLKHIAPYLPSSVRRMASTAAILLALGL